MSPTTPYRVTSAEELPPKKRRTRWWLIFSIFAIPFALVAATVFAFRIGWTIRENQGRKAMEIELQRLLDDGIAIDNQALSELYQRRTSDDFTEDWTSLFTALSSPEFAASSAGVPTVDLRVEVDDFADDFDTSAEWEFAERCIRFTQEQSELISQARKLATEPKPTYFPIIFQSTETLLPEVQSTRTVAWLLRTDAQVAIHFGDNARAFEDISALFELSKHVDAVPFVVSRLVGHAVRRLALQSLQNAIRIDLLDDDQLREIDGLLSRYSDIDDRWRTLMTDEMSCNLPVFVNPNISMQTDTVIPARGHDAVYFIGFMRKAIALPSDDLSRLYDSSLELESELEEGIDSTAESVDRLLSGLLTPAFGSLAAALINDAQLHRQARVAISLRLYQHQHNRLPSTLNELPETVATLMPHGERPFGYSIDDSQAVLWGYLLSPEKRQTPPQIPETEQANTESLNNRAVVWWLDVLNTPDLSIED